MAALVLACLLAYTWGLDQNAWGNPFYAAAAQAGARDWEAFFFGSQDWNNAITIDKLPLSIWPAALSIRFFGLSSWSVLVPEAVMGSATVWLTYASVRRLFPAAVAFTAAVLCASAPVFFLMSRYNNPEPLMGLLIAAGLYFAVRAAEDVRWRWYLLMGASFGLAFLAKQVQGLVPVPAIGLGLLMLGPGHLRGRVARLAAATAAMIVAGGWWVAIVELIPASARPYIGGSIGNSAVELTLDYNGAARLIQLPVGQSAGLATGAAQSTSYDGGLSRLFNGNFAPEIAWLLGTGVVSVVILLVYGRLLGGRLQRAFILMSVIWFVSTWFLISFMGSMVHTYYVYSVAVPMALVVALGLRAAWLRSDLLIGRLFGTFLIAATAFMGVRIMQYSDVWGWWGPAVLIILATLASALWVTRAAQRIPAKVFWAVVVLALAAGQIGTDAFTAASSNQGTQPISGPISNDPNAMSRHLLDIRTTGQPAWAPHIAYGVAPSPELLHLFATQGSGTGRWLAATYPAQDAALTQLSTGRAVLSVGGWLGLDPAPTLEQFKAWAEDGDVEFFVDEPAIKTYGIGPQAKAISDWVSATYRGQEVDGAVVYRLDAGHRR